MLISELEAVQIVARRRRYFTDRYSDLCKDATIHSPNLDGRVQILWHEAYYDGAMSGFAEVDGVAGFWVHTIEENYNYRLDIDEDCKGCDCDEPCVTWSRCFVVYKLTSKQSKWLMDKQAARCETFGDSNVYVKDRATKKGFVKNPDTASFKKKYQTTTVMLPINSMRLVGWTVNIYSKGYSR